MATKRKKEQKRYYWFKLYSDFFNSARIKKLRKVAGGDTYTIIYLKMQLKALNQDGYLYFNGYFGDFYEELALDIDEDPTNVRITCEYLLSVGLLEVSGDGKEYYLTYLKNCIGSESASAKRVRDYREREKEKQKALQSNESVTKTLQCNAPPLQCNAPTLQSNIDVTPCNDSVTQVIRRERERERENINISNTDVLDISSDKENLSDSESDSVTLSPEVKEQILDKWNELEPYGITPIRIIGPKTERGKMLRARLRQYGTDSFFEAVEQIKQSDFLQGKNSRGWQITFDWLVHPNNYPKVIEGNYKTSHAAKQTQSNNGARNFLPSMSTYDNENFSELEEQLLDN